MSRSRAFAAAVRRVHRVLAPVFAVAVVANFAVLGRGTLALWVGTATLVPLALLLVTGLVLFARPYFARRPVAPAAQEEMR